MEADIWTRNGWVVHELKVWPEFYDAIARGDKTFEVRKDDRGYEANHVLHLRRYDPEKEEYTGQSMRKRVSYIMRGGRFGLEPGHVVMALSRDVLYEGLNYGPYGCPTKDM